LIFAQAGKEFANGTKCQMDEPIGFSQVPMGLFTLSKYAPINVAAPRATTPQARRSAF
jgi:hypothetical protein